MPVPPRRIRDHRADRVIVRIDQEALRTRHSAPSGEVVEPDNTPPTPAPSPTSDIIWTFDHGIAKWKGYQLDTGAEFDGGVTRYATTGMGSLVGEAVRYDDTDNVIGFFNGTAVSNGTSGGTGGGAPPGESVGDADPTFCAGTMWHYWPINGFSPVLTEVSEWPGELGRQTNPETGTLTANGLPYGTIGVDGSQAGVFNTGESALHVEVEAFDAYAVAVRFRIDDTVETLPTGREWDVARGPGNKNQITLVNTAGSLGVQWGDIDVEITDQTAWHSAVGVFDGSRAQQKLYVDGSLAGSLGVQVLGVEPSANWLTNGTWTYPDYTGAATGAQMAIDDVIFWGESVGPTIAAEYDSIGTIEVSLNDAWAYWDMADTTDTDRQDETANNRDLFCWPGNVHLGTAGFGRSFTSMAGTNHTIPVTTGSLSGPSTNLSAWTLAFDSRVANADGTTSSVPETLFSVGSMSVKAYDIVGTTSYTLSVESPSGTLSTVVSHAGAVTGLQEGYFNHIAVTADGAETVLYVQQEQVGSIAVHTAWNGSIVLPRPQGVRNKMYDEVGVWSRAITPTEVALVGSANNDLDLVSATSSTSWPLPSYVAEGTTVLNLCSPTDQGWTLIPTGETNGTGGIGLTMSEPPAPTHQYKHRSLLSIGNDEFGLKNFVNENAGLVTGLDGNAFNSTVPTPTIPDLGVLVWDASTYPAVQPYIPSGSTFSVTGWVYLDFADGIYNNKRVQPFALTAPSPPFENYYVEPVRMDPTGDHIRFRFYWRGTGGHFHREDIDFNGVRGRWMFWAFVHQDSAPGRLFVGVPRVGVRYQEVAAAASTWSRDDQHAFLGGSTGIFYDATDTVKMDETHVWVGHALSEQEIYYMYADEIGRTYQV